MLPRVRKSRPALAATELVPFVRAIAAGLPALMTAHVVYDALDRRHPATMSAAVCRRLLRRRLGFHGVLFTDDLEMQAVAGRTTPERAAVGALAAGCDMLLVCKSLAVARRAMLGVEAAHREGPARRRGRRPLARTHPGAAPTAPSAADVDACRAPLAGARSAGDAAQGVSTTLRQPSCRSPKTS